jgi:hypothetical protein
MHWSDRFVGRPYVVQDGDCAALASDVARSILGLDPALPSSHAKGHRNQGAQVLAHKDALAKRVELPKDGHPVLFVARGRLCHIGVACQIQGETWILHADQSVGFVVRERLSRMNQTFRYQLEGFYQWI